MTRIQDYLLEEETEGMIVINSSIFDDVKKALSPGIEDITLVTPEGFCLANFEVENCFWSAADFEAFNIMVVENEVKNNA